MPTTFRASRPFTVSEYHAMARAGILSEDDRVELIEGQVTPMSPIGSRHANCVRRLTRLFFLQVDPHATVSVQNPIRLDPHSEPEPDLALLAPKDVYAARHPRPDEVPLVVEIAETSLAFDREVKLPLYARAGIPEVWLVALEEDAVLTCRTPTPEGYAAVARHERGTTIQVEALPACGSFETTDLLGP